MYDYLRNSAGAIRRALAGHRLRGLRKHDPAKPHDDNSNSARWRLVFVVATPYWLYVTLARTVMFGLLFAKNPGVIIALPWVRGLQHLILFPLLLVCYRLAFEIGWPAVRRTRAVIYHLGLGLLFAVLARPVLLSLLATTTGDRTLYTELIHSRYGPTFAVDVWISTGSDFLLSYFFGLGLLAGVHMFRELKHQKFRSAHLESAWIRARLHALRMQLNPHFLFNTLNATVAVVHSNPEAAEQMLIRLADLLRRALRDGESDQVTLEREIEFLRSYFEIQRLRFAGRLSFDLNVDSDVQNASVPSLLLQPLAENAVIHGMADDGDRVRVRLTAHRDGAALVIDIENNAGAIRSGSRGYGIGLGNTRERLSAMYGDRQSVELFPPKNGVVVARVRIPYVPLAA